MNSSFVSDPKLSYAIIDFFDKTIIPTAIDNKSDANINSVLFLLSIFASKSFSVIY